MSIIHCNLRVLMAERGLNIQKVKDQTSLSRTTISNLYNNLGSGIQFGTLLELCELLNCKPGDLLTYIQIKPVFEITNDKIEIEIVEDSETVDELGNTCDYVSSIETKLNIYCLLTYEGQKYDFVFKIDVRFEIDVNKCVQRVHIGISNEFEESMTALGILPHAAENIDEELCDFVIDWGYEYFYGEEIESIGNITIERYTLQD